VTTLPDRPNTALLVIDVQTGVMAGAHQRARVIANIQALVEKARSEGIPVVWVQHSSDHLPRGSEEWRYVPELEQVDSEPVVHKHYGDSFEETELEALLADRGVGGSSSPGRRPTSASARRCTARSSAATTRRSSATLTRRRTRARGARRRPSR